MRWKGEELRTIGDLMNKGIDRCDTPEEAQEFMRLYRAENEHADENIGYLSGYYSPERAQQIREWFGVVHPIFGKSMPTVEEAINAGKQLAYNIKSNE
jgi:hypothetical protein